ncbi:MAG: 30S ribosomal protein S6 [Pseudomonadota bacterium]|nr:MAG: 30S ribosomal protein S6 [Pseudomonadota bacterium]
MSENVAAARPQKVAPTSQTLREYETIYLLRQDLTPEQVDRIKERLRGIIDRNGGRVIRFTTWGKKKTAFPVGNKENRAIYVHVLYLGKGGLVAEVERNLRNFEEVLKFQTLKVSDAVLPETRPTEEDVVFEGDREDERPARDAQSEGGEEAEASGAEEEAQEEGDSEDASEESGD